jgi:anaerobic selenocysteine-containing dehydrogenase
MSMDRRSFIKLTAVSSGTAALAACGNPDHELIRFVPDEDITPGIATWKPGVCTLCAAGCGLTVRVMDADQEIVRDGVAGLKRIYAAKKLEGNPAHPVNHGGLCARGQASIQVTYHPDRITQPLRRAGERGDGKYEAISWDDAIAQLVGKLDELEGAGNQQALTLVTRPGRSHRAELIVRFLAGFGAPPPVVHDLFGEHVLREANSLSAGRYQLPTFDLANARYVISFGADFLGTWNSPVSQNAAYGAMRQGRPGLRGSFVQVESRMSQTGANADEWVPAVPGSEGVLALAMVRAIVDAGLRPETRLGAAGSLFDGWKNSPDAAPESVETLTGVSSARIERLARAFVERSPSVAIVGGAPLAGSNGLFVAMAVNALNAINGSVAEPGGVFFTPQLQLPGASRGTPAIGGAGGFSLGGAALPQVLLLDGANPVHTAPPAMKLRDSLRAVPFIASFGQFLDETSSLADLILPDHSFLEQWTDAMPESGSLVAVVSVAAPVMAPLHQTRATTDLLLEVGRMLRKPLALPWQTFEEMLTATFMTLPPATEGGDAWAEAQEKGGWWGTLPPTQAVPAVAASGGASTVGYTEGAGAVALDGDPSQFPLRLMPYPSSMFLDGSLAHLPWLQETPDPMTSAMWSSWIEINPSTAAKLSVTTGDVVEVTSSAGSLRTAVIVSPGTAPDVVAMPMGQGHTMFTRYASGRGENPAVLLSDGAWAAMRVKVTRVGGADGRLILFAGGDRDHDQQHEYGHAGRG